MPESIHFREGSSIDFHVILRCPFNCSRRSLEVFLEKIDIQNESLKGLEKMQEIWNFFEMEIRVFRPGKDFPETKRCDYWGRNLGFLYGLKRNLYLFKTYLWFRKIDRNLSLETLNRQVLGDVELFNIRNHDHNLGKIIYLNKEDFSALSEGFEKLSIRVEPCEILFPEQYLFLILNPDDATLNEFDSKNFGICCFSFGISTKFRADDSFYKERHLYLLMRIINLAEKAACFALPVAFTSLLLKIFSKLFG